MIWQEHNLRLLREADNICDLKRVSEEFVADINGEYWQVFGVMFADVEIVTIQHFDTVNRACEQLRKNGLTVLNHVPIACRAAELLGGIHVGWRNPEFCTFIQNFFSHCLSSEGHQGIYLLPGCSAHTQHSFPENIQGLGVRIESFPFM
tara:strand:+ start:494 stop:940 length:447 start_codon:yes stop_codon:yes gene_type:complete